MVHAIGSKFSTDGNRLTTLIESHTAEIPTKSAINFQAGQRYALMDVSSQARAYGAGLAGLKYGEKDTILLVLPNTIDRLNLQLAASYAGCKVAAVENSEDVDVHACIKASKARAVFVPSNLVSKVRSAVPELTLSGTSRENNPRFFNGNATEMRPIGSQEFPHLKQVFQTGTAREPRVHLLRHLPLYFPIPNPLSKVTPQAENAPFYTALSPKGEVLKTSSREELLSHADKIATGLSLKPDEAVLLCTKGDPYSTFVSALACISSWAQLVVPNPKDQSKWEAFAKTEGIVAAIGDVNIPSSAGPRVVKL